MTTTYQNKKPDSPKGRCFIAWQEGGEEKARAIASELGVANVRINRWLKPNGWQSVNDKNRTRAAERKVDAPTPEPPTQPPVADTTPEPAKTPPKEIKQAASKAKAAPAKKAPAKPAAKTKKPAKGSKTKKAA